MLQSGQAEATLKAGVERSRVLHTIRIQVTSRGRQVYLDHSSYQRVSEYILSFVALTFTPEEVTLFRGSPQERRRFFNRIQVILDPTYFRILQEYAKALAQKNALLKLHNPERLPLWNRILARHAMKMVRHRQEFTELVNQHVVGLFKKLSGREERLELQYQPSLTMDGNSEEGLLSELESFTDRELRAGHSLLGPHRDDFQLRLDCLPDREFFSQGEFRITNLALKMSLNQLLFQLYQIHPILIFDDLFSELDQRMNSRIMEYFLNLENQVFITSTTPPNRENPGKTLHISQGRPV